ncbi:MAG TPA: tetratricopeptide repeat protein [Candidatus Kapabacteria bacterium]|nr:tetratricopeptide repeat protein [Candidatus Kapabacteria bacterium]
MELNEEKELKKASDDLTEAIKIFRTKDYEKADNAFRSIVEQYKDSEYFSVLEIQARAKVYKNICHTQLNPLKVVCTSEEDFLNEGIFNLNQKNFDKAQELLESLGKKKYKESYVNYLLSIVYLKKKDIPASLEYLKKAVKKDESYKIIAHNESDFDELFDNEEFISIVQK